MIQGSTGTPNRHLEVQVFIFIDFTLYLGVSWDPLWTHFRDLSVIWGGKVGDSFQVYVFDDPGLELAVCAITIVKTMVFGWFHIFHLFTDFVS